MLNIVNVKLENKTDKPFMYYIANSKLTLNPNTPVTIAGDIFSRETRQEGNTEGLLVNIYNGNIELTLIYDKTFITKVEAADIVKLPKRAQVKLIDKSVKKEVVKEEPKKEEVKPVVKEEVKEEVKPVVKEEPKKETKVEPVKEEIKTSVADTKKAETESLENTSVEDGKAKTKKVTKL